MYIAEQKKDQLICSLAHSRNSSIVEGHAASNDKNRGREIEQRTHRSCRTFQICRQWCEQSQRTATGQRCSTTGRYSDHLPCILTDSLSTLFCHRLEPEIVVLWLPSGLSAGRIDHLGLRLVQAIVNYRIRTSSPSYLASTCCNARPFCPAGSRRPQKATAFSIAASVNKSYNLIVRTNRCFSGPTLSLQS